MKILFSLLFLLFTPFFSSNADELLVSQPHTRAYMELFFDFDSYELSDASVSQLASFLDQKRGLQGTFEIVGFTDPKGEAFYNMILSQRRIKAVRSIMVESGIAERHIVLRPKGEHRRKVQSEQDIEIPQNRKVEVVFLPH
jgi:outer membrane protein OmpA-like peptidoglycan-associated protein